MRKLLVVGDAAVQTGFARATHAMVDVLKETWDTSILGIGYRGDPHTYTDGQGKPLRIYPAYPGGDVFGVKRLLWVMDIEHPDAILLQQDPWNIPQYMQQLRSAPEFDKVPVAGAIAVDGTNCRGAGMNSLALAVFWTEFGRREAVRGGFAQPAHVVPLGVDLDLFKPMDKREARALCASGRMPAVMPRGHSRDEAFIVGNVNRNQPRKRLDLLIQYFAGWVTSCAIDNAYLYLHVAPTGDDGYDCLQLARYYGVADRLILVEPEVYNGDSDEGMVHTYNSFDVNATTTQGEGFGLTTLEAMACGIPCVLPGWSALGELFDDSAIVVPCSTTIATHSRINSIGGIADREPFMAALNDVYVLPGVAGRLKADGIRKAHEPQYRWRRVGEGFRDALETLQIR